jgi:signal transduction histidine kinase
VYKRQGLGFDVKKLENKLFGLHQRFHQHKEGRGLGLYLIKTQLRMLGGTIELESKPYEGSTFIITF